MPDPLKRATTPRGRYAKGVRSQTEIIAKATDLFMRQGYHGTSMREVALAVGLTHPGLTHHFPTKEVLLEAVLEHREDTSVDRFKSTEISPTEKLRMLIRAHIEERASVQFEMNIAAEAIDPDHPAHEFFQRHYERARKLFTALVKRGQDAGEFRKDIPAAQLAMVLVSAMVGANLQWLMGPNVKLDSALESLLRVLQPPS